MQALATASLAIETADTATSPVDSVPPVERTPVTVR
jgi:hypothetical protein